MVGRFALYSSLTFPFATLHVNKSNSRPLKLKILQKRASPSSRRERGKVYGNYWDWKVEKKKVKSSEGEIPS